MDFFHLSRMRRIQQQFSLLCQKQCCHQPVICSSPGDSKVFQRRTEHLPEPILGMVPSYPTKSVSLSYWKDLTLLGSVSQKGKPSRKWFIGTFPKTSIPTMQALKSCKRLENNYDFSLSEPCVEEMSLHLV